MTANIDITTLRALNGTALKLYILLSDRPEGATAKQLADLLGVRESTIYYALSEFQKNGIDSKKLENKFQIIGKFQKNGIEKETKEKALLPHTPNLEKEKKEKAGYLSIDEEKIILTYIHMEEKDFLKLITGNPALNKEGETFLDWLKSTDKDWTQKTLRKVRRHFLHWLPKYQDKMDIEAKEKAAKEEPAKTENQLSPKQVREAEAADLQAHIKKQEEERAPVPDWARNFGKPKTTPPK